MSKYFIATIKATDSQEINCHILVETNNFDRHIKEILAGWVDDAKHDESRDCWYNDDTTYWFDRNQEIPQETFNELKHYLPTYID